MCNLYYLFKVFNRIFKNRMNTDELDIILTSNKYNRPITSDDYINNQENNSIVYEPNYTFMPINTDIDDIADIVHNNNQSVSISINEKDEEKWDNESIYEEHDVDIDPRFATSNKENYSIYKKPPRSSISARHIWKVAGLSKEACLYQIELHLIDWAHKNAELTTDNFNITQIRWKCNKTNTSYTSPWKVFVKWILCSCNTTV